MDDAWFDEIITGAQALLVAETADTAPDYQAPLESEQQRQNVQRQSRRTQRDQARRDVAGSSSSGDLTAAYLRVQTPAVVQPVLNRAIYGLPQAPLLLGGRHGCQHQRQAGTRTES